VWGGLDIIKLTKTPPIYSVSRFNFEELGALFGGAKPTNAPRGNGIVAKLLVSMGRNPEPKLPLILRLWS